MVKWKRPPAGCIILAMIPLALIGVMLLSFIRSFYNNWIAENEANRRLPEYVRQTYPELDLTLSQATLEPKSSAYYAIARSATSPDTHFEVRWNRIGSISDDYKNKVLEGVNTLERLGHEMNTEIELLLKGMFSDQLQRHITTFIGREGVGHRPPLDTPFSRDLQIPAIIYLDLIGADPTLEDAAQKMQQADALLKHERYSVRSYRVQVRDHDAKQGYDISINADRINERLVEELKEALHSDAYDERLHVRAYRQPTELMDQERRRRRLGVVVFLTAISALIAILAGLARSVWLEMKS